MTVSSSPPAPRSTLLGAWSRHGPATLVSVATFHLAALATLAWSETGLERMAIFAAAWGLLNFVWLVVLCRPGLSAALSLLVLGILILVSRFQFGCLSVSVGFIHCIARA